MKSRARVWIVLAIGLAVCLSGCSFFDKGDGAPTYTVPWNGHGDGSGLCRGVGYPSPTGSYSYSGQLLGSRGAVGTDTYSISGVRAGTYDGTVVITIPLNITPSTASYTQDGGNSVILDTPPTAGGSSGAYTFTYSISGIVITGNTTIDFLLAAMQPT